MSKVYLVGVDAHIDPKSAENNEDGQCSSSKVNRGLVSLPLL